MPRSKKVEHILTHSDFKPNQEVYLTYALSTSENPDLELRQGIITAYKQRFIEVTVKPIEVEFKSITKEKKKKQKVQKEPTKVNLQPDPPLVLKFDTYNNCKSTQYPVRWKLHLNKKEAEKYILLQAKKKYLYNAMKTNNSFYLYDLFTEYEVNEVYRVVKKHVEEMDLSELSDDNDDYIF